MVYIFKTHPFNMSFNEIKKMKFNQALIMIEEYKNDMKEKSKAVQEMAKRSKDLTPVFDVSRGIYG